MLEPPFCPYRRCPQHIRPAPRFDSRHGSYPCLCRPRPVPRFRCKSCRRTFSRQTFRMDYCDNRPSLNPRLFELLASGIGLRQSSRILGLSRRCTELKARKIGRHLRRLNLNLRGQLPPGSSFQLDELETYEGRRNTRPLSVPTLIETKSRFIVWAEAAPIRPKGTMTPQRLAAIRADRRRFGLRKDLSRRSLVRTLQRGVDLSRRLGSVLVDTDEKASYPGLLEDAFGSARLDHIQTSSKRLRTSDNPLFAINQTEAIMRDLTGRVRRESWLVSKLRRWLDVALHVHITYRNYVRRRFNRDQASPAELLGFVKRRLRPPEVLSWRQEFGARSLHPLGHGVRRIEEESGRAFRAA